MKKRLAFFVACATAVTVILNSSAAHADPITYQGCLNDGQPETDTIGVGGQGDPVTGRYWTFFGNQGDIVTITVRRLESALDPALFIYEGTFTDTDQFGGSLFIGPGLQCFGDDEIPVPGGPFGDPQCVVTMTLPGTGQYTAVVSQSASDPPGPDGVYDYEITASGVVNCDDFLELIGLDTSYSPSDPRAAAGVFTITSTFRNISSRSFTDLFFEIMILTGGNVVVNADGGPGGVGSKVSVPGTALGTDAILSPGESFTQTFEIGLAVPSQFTFFVDASGVPVAP